MMSRRVETPCRGSRAYGPANSSRLWKRRKLQGMWDGTSAGVSPELSDLILKGIAKRRSEFRPCRFCKEAVPPEHRTMGACHGCAEKHLGVVY